MTRLKHAPARTEQYRKFTSTHLMQLLRALLTELVKLDVRPNPARDPDNTVEILLDYAAHSVLRSALLEELIARSCEQLAALAEPRLSLVIGLAELVQQHIEQAATAAKTLDAQSVVFVRDTLRASALPGVVDPIAAALYATQVNTIQLTAAHARSAFVPLLAELHALAAAAGGGMVRDN